MDRFSEHRIMQVLVLFDLPAETKKDKRKHTDFEKIYKGWLYNVSVFNLRPSLC